MSKSEAIAKLVELGATHEQKENQHGETKSGWWMDTVFLAPYSKPQMALEAING